MRQLSPHPNVVQLHAVEQKKGSGPEQEVYFLMDLCTGGTLYNVMERFEEQHLSYKQLLQLFFHVSRAVAHMHAQDPPIAHRDLKLENVLLHRGSGMFKLCDFGSCTTRAKRYVSRQEILDEEEEIQRYSTDMYCAPEMCDLYTGQMVSEKVDVWALGCILYTLIYWKHPFQDEGKLGIVNANPPYPSLGPKFPPELLKVLKVCLTNDPDKRPSSSQVVDMVKMLLKAQKAKGNSGNAQRVTAQSDGFSSFAARAPAPADDGFAALAGRGSTQAGADKFSAISNRNTSTESNFADFGSSQPASEQSGWADFGSASASGGSTIPAESSLEDYGSSSLDDFAPSPEPAPPQASAQPDDGFANFGDFGADASASSQNDFGDFGNFGDFGADTSASSQQGPGDFGDFGDTSAATQQGPGDFGDFDAFGGGPAQTAQPGGIDDLTGGIDDLLTPSSQAAQTGQHGGQQQMYQGMGQPGGTTYQQQQYMQHQMMMQQQMAMGQMGMNQQQQMMGGMMQPTEAPMTQAQKQDQVRRIMAQQ